MRLTKTHASANIMTPQPPVPTSRGFSLIIRWLIAWAVCFLVYLAAVWSDWPPGPGTLGIHMFVIAAGFIPAVILALVSHNLLGIELIMYVFLTIPVLLGGAIGKLIRVVIARRRK